MEENKDFYKVGQVIALFVSKYNFETLLMDEFDDYLKCESWLYNYSDNNYQVIRVSYKDYDFSKEEDHRFNTYLSYFSKMAGKECKFLDVHVTNHKFDKVRNEGDQVFVEVNYYDGINLENIYPDIYHCVHVTANINEEVKRLVNTLKEAERKKRKSVPFFKRNDCFYTYLMIGICCLMFIAQSILSIYYDQTSVMILLGADYKLLTLGCHEYYRLITYAFLHSGFLHLFCNMISLFSLGRFVEKLYGHTKYLIILFVSILCGSLTQGILSDNELCIGMSGGIYGLFIIYLIAIYNYKIFDLRRLFPIILLNILLNFNTSVAWMCHLGGAIAGITTYYAFSKDKNYPGYLLIVVLLIGLLFKYLSIDTINTFYGGTDYQYVSLLEQLNIDPTTITTKILEAYTKYGGY